jgi:hypothetical protein
VYAGSIKSPTVIAAVIWRPVMTTTLVALMFVAAHVLKAIPI